MALTHAPGEAPPALTSGKRWAIMGAVMLGLFLSAMDQTVVGTAMPRIIAELSGLELYAWVFTAYMLTSTTFVPIVGKMGDVYGRRRFLLAGIVVFLFGSALSGMSQSMMQLIVFRGAQGIGGGLIFANAFAILGDLYTAAERGKYAGLMSSVFGLASVIGPLIGGTITDNFDWRWVFYVNIPLGLVALVVLWLVLPASRADAPGRSLDYAGAAALAAAIAPLLLAFSWAGNDYGWTDRRVLTPFLVSAAMFALFITLERRAADPIVPLSLFRNSIFTVSNVVTVVSGAAMFSGSVYIPLFMQGVLGFSATNAGLVLTPMTIAMVVGSIAGGQLISRTGRYRGVVPAGLAVSALGLYLLSRLDADSSQLAGIRDMAIIGFGIGFTFPVLMIAAQNAVPDSMLGVVSSLSQFARSVGGTIGVAIMGSLLARRLDDELAAGLPAEVREGAPAPLLEAITNPRLLLDDGALARVRDQGFAPVFGADAPRLFEASIASMRDALAISIADVFLLAAVLMALAAGLGLLLREIPLSSTRDLPQNVATPTGAQDLAPSLSPRPAPGSAPRNPGL